MSVHRRTRSERCGRFRTFTLAALLIVLGATHAGATEGQYWGRLGLRVGVGGTTFGLLLESRSEGGINDGYYTSVDGGVEQPLGEHMRVGGHYAHIEREGRTSWSTEHRPYADAAVHWKVSRLGVEDRNRLEVRFRDGDRDFRYRNRFRLSHPVVAGISASVDDEIFVDLEDTEWNRNRVTTGIQMQLGNGLSVGVFHAFESSKAEEDWTGFHVLGGSLNFGMKLQGGSPK